MLADELYIQLMFSLFISNGRLVGQLYEILLDRSLPDFHH